MKYINERPKTIGEYFYDRKNDKISNYIENFSRFYKELPNKKDIYYIYFTSGLLHWYNKMNSFIPKHINVVVLCAYLSEEEKIWMEHNSERPFINFDDYFDVNTAFEILFAVNEEDFGWVDVDCFVLNPHLFSEMSNIDHKTSINCIWSYDFSKRISKGTHSLPILRTYFLYFNINAIQSIFHKFKVTPRYCIENKDAISHDIESFFDYNLVTSFQKKFLDSYLPKNHYGAPIYPFDYMRKKGYNVPYLDTLVLYQLLTQCEGYHLNQVRKYTEDLPGQYYSDESIHVGSSSYYKNFINKTFEFVDDVQLNAYKGHYKNVLCLDYIVLAQSYHLLPDSYKIQRRMADIDIKRIGMSSQQVYKHVKNLFGKDGVSEEMIERIFANQGGVQ